MSLRAGLLLAAALCLAGPAQAVLGESLASVHADQLRVHGARHATQALRYQVHDITQADGSVLRQYATPAGRVFAVSWRSHLKPRLRELLGSRFDTYTQATRAAAPPQGSTRRNAVREADLVVSESMQMGLYTGRAHVPSLVPEGVDPNALP